MLTAYQNGECRSSEAAALEKHLAACPGCAAELEELRRLDRVLDLWQDEPTPTGLWEAVMSEVEGISRTDAPAIYGTPFSGTGKAGRTGRVMTIKPALLLRDLAVAAAVSTIIFWGSGAWLAGERMLAAGESINGAVSVYTRVTGAAMERATGTAGEYTRKILFEEWEQDEMYKSPGS